MIAETAFLLALTALVLAVVALIRTRDLRARLTSLEDRLSAARDEGQETQAARPRTAQESTRRDPWAPKPAHPNSVSQETSVSASPERPDRGNGLSAFGEWMRTNWIYPVAAAALIMAAVYLVQYSIERGLLSPLARILLTVVLGAALIGVGTGIRRRWGDEGTSARFLPSTLSGAGVVALLIAPLAAFHLYGMIGQGGTLLLLAGVALLAVVLGWVHGPLLAAIGVIAGAAAPFLLGEGDAPKDLLYPYFVGVAVIGLTIAGLRRWGWTAMLAVLAPLAGVVMIRLAGAGPIGFAGSLMVLPLLAMALPSGAVMPRATGPMLSAALRRKGVPGPDTRAAGVAMLLSCIGLVWLGEIGLSALAVLALALAQPLWSLRAPALADQAVLPVLALPAALAVDRLTRGAEITHVLFFASWLPVVAVALAALAGLAMLWRGTREEGAARDLWSLVGIATPGGTFIAFEGFWRVQALGGALSWPFVAMALAAGFTAVALWAARRDAGQGLRLGGAATGAYTMIALALMLLLGQTALTGALAVLMLVSAVMDRRFDIPMLGLFQALASMVLGYRLIVDPGFDWALMPPETGGATLLEFWVTMLAVLGAPTLTLWMTTRLQAGAIRNWARFFLETGLSGAVPMALLLTYARLFTDLGLHAVLGLETSVLIAVAWVQAQRATQVGQGRWLTLLRRVFCWIAGAIALALILLAATVASPVFGGWLFGGQVQGPPLVNDLVLAYAAPGLLLLWIARGRWQVAMRVLGGVLLAEWVAMVIRHLWHGAAGMRLSSGFAQGELYAYTVALLLAGAGSLALSLRLGRNALRVLGLGLIGLAAAKAFLIDASGLTGLLRVGAFLGLGLSLAGLAWLNTWVRARQQGVDGDGKF